MTEEQFNILLKYDQHMKNAQKGFVHGLSRMQMTELSNVATQLNIKAGSISCPKCCYNTVTALSKLYYQYIDSKATKLDSSINLNNDEINAPDETNGAPKSVIDDNDTVDDKPVIEQTKKRGRPSSKKTAE